MSRPQTHDLTTGSIPSHFLTLAVPAGLGMLFSTLYNIVDIWFAGLLATDAQAGLALGFQVFYIFIALGIGLGSAMGVLVGNALGARDRRQARRAGAQGVSFGIVASVILSVIGLGLGPHVIAFLSEPGNYRDAANGYFRWLLLALPGFLIAYGCNGVLQAQGDSRSMLYGLIVAFFANIGLNPLLMFGIPGLWSGMGFNGIALSSAISQSGVMLWILYRALQSDVLRGLRQRHFKPRLDGFSEIARQSFPVTFAMLIMFLSGFVVQFALKGFGEHAIAGFGIGIRVEQILLLPVLGMTSALLPILSQNIGARDYDRTREALFFCWKAGFVITISAAVILWTAGGWILSWFSKDPEVLRVGILYLRIDGVILPLYMLLFSINSLLQALKLPGWTVWIGLYRQGFGIAFFAWIFIGVLGFNEAGVWYGTICAVSTGCALSLWLASRAAQERIGGLWGAQAVT
jgi:putative MATE family efflux protein